MAHTLFIADDHKIFRDAMRPILNRTNDYDVIGEASDGLEAWRMIREMQPDLAIIDLTMPGFNGIEVTRQITTQLPGTRVIILSMHADRRFVIEALRAGALGYVLKESSIEELYSALKMVTQGRIFLSPVVSDQLLREFVDTIESKKSSPFELLSSREREVLQLIAEGHSTRSIAQTLNLSVKTVETHRSQIKGKLKLQSVAELTKYAIREGLTSLE